MVGLAVTAGPTDIGEGHITILPHAYSSITAGTWAFLADASQFTGWLFSNVGAAASGDRINYKLFMAKGSYTVTVLTANETNSGILKLLVDGSQVGSAVDLYHALVTTYNNLSTFTFDVNSSGLVELSLLTNTKNAASAGYQIFLTSISIYRTA